MNFSELYNSLITESSTIITSNEFKMPKGDFSAWVWADDGVIRLIVNDKTSQGHIGLAKKVIEYYNPEKFKDLVTKYGNKVDAYYEFMMTYLGAARIAVYEDIHYLMFHIDGNKISSQTKNWLYDLMSIWKGKVQLEDGKFFTEDKKQALEHLKSSSIAKNYVSPLLQFREDKSLMKNIMIYNNENQLNYFKNKLIENKSNDFSAWVWEQDGKLKLIVYDNGKSDANQRHPLLAQFYFETYEPEIFNKLEELTNKETDFETNLKNYMFNDLQAIRIAYYKSFKKIIINYDKSSKLTKNYISELITDWNYKMELENNNKFFTNKKEILEFLKSNNVYKSPLAQFREAKQSYNLLELTSNKLIEMFNNKFYDFSAIIFKENNKDVVYFVKATESHFVLIDFLFNRPKYSKLKNRILTKYNIEDFSDESLDNLSERDFDNFSFDIYNLFFKELQGARIGIQNQEFFMEYYSIPESIKSILYQLTEKWFKRIHLSIDNSAKDFNNKEDILNYLNSNKPKTKLSSFSDFYKNYKADSLYNESTKNKAYVFDVDETLLHTSAKIQIFDKQTHEYIRSITPFEFTTEKLKNNEVYLGDKSFTEFDSIDKDSTEPIAYTGKIIRNIFKHQKQDKIFILTARKNLCKQSIQDALKHFFNVSLPIENIYTMGDSKGISISEAKKQVLEQLLTRFDEIEFFDDDKANIDKASSIPNVKTRLINITKS